MLVLLLVSKIHQINCVQYLQCVFSLIDVSDYGGFTRLYTFESATDVINVSVTIPDDGIFELTELFNASLAFPGDPIPRVILAPDSAQVTILDDDG